MSVWFSGTGLAPGIVLGRAWVLTGAAEPPGVSEPWILLAASAAEAVTLVGRTDVAGLVVDAGDEAEVAAIRAARPDWPILVVGAATTRVQPGELLIMDAAGGHLLADPDAIAVAHFRSRAA